MEVEGCSGPQFVSLKDLVLLFPLFFPLGFAPSALPAPGAPRPFGNRDIPVFWVFWGGGFSAGWRLPGAAARGIKSWNCDVEKPGEVGGGHLSAQAQPGPCHGFTRDRERKREGKIQREKSSRVWIPWEGIPARNSRRRGRKAALECGKLEDLLEDLKNELEKRQEKKNPEISQPDIPSQGQEEKNQQPDAKSSLSRCGKVTFQLPLDAAPGLEERVCHFSWRSSALKETLRKLQASVTLDPDTAHPDLVLSQDGKSVWRGAGGHRSPPDSPERFDHWPFVLGHQRFSSGRHCWDVDVGDGGDWAVGVARESVRRKGRLSLGPQGGIWGLEKWGGQVRALTARKVTLVALRWLPRRVSVHLDCGGGTVAFFDAEDGGLLFAFSRVAFGGERVRPWLWVVGVRSQLRLCP